MCDKSMTELLKERDYKDANYERLNKEGWEQIAYSGLIDTHPEIPVPKSYDDICIYQKENNFEIVRKNGDRFYTIGCTSKGFRELLDNLLYYLKTEMEALARAGK